MIATVIAAGLCAAPHGYALSIGNNAIPEGAVDLERLSYADDDAARFHELFSRAGMQSELLTVVDAPSQRRYPELAAEAGAPTVTNLERAIGQMQSGLLRDRAAGVSTVAYLYFSGHGGVNAQGEPYLALLDGQLTRTRLFEDLLDRLPADRVHVIIDACNAGAVVGLRGPFDGASEAARTPLGEAELAAITDRDRLARYPHVGFLVASAAGRAAHEWSRIESGVFSHEVYSALVGGSDVNRDDRVEYSEVEAFVSAANARLENARTQLSLRTHPPPADGRAPIFDLGWLGGGPFLVGEASRGMRMFVERNDGQRVFDLHLGPGMRFKVALPVDTIAFVRTRGHEARVEARAHGAIELNSLDFSARTATERGALDDALKRGLFAEPFSVAYYLGFANSQGRRPVPIEPGGPKGLDYRSEPTRPHDGLVTAAWFGAAAATGAALVAGGFALERRRAFSSAATQREAGDISRQHAVARNVAIGSAIGAGALAAGAALLGSWANDEAVVVTARPEPDGWRAAVGWSGRF